MKPQSYITNLNRKIIKFLIKINAKVAKIKNMIALKLKL